MQYKWAVQVYEGGFWYTKFRYETKEEAQRFAKLCRRDGVKARVIESSKIK